MEKACVALRKEGICVSHGRGRSRDAWHIMSTMRHLHAKGLGVLCLLNNWTLIPRSETIYLIAIASTKSGSTLVRIKIGHAKMLALRVFETPERQVAPVNLLQRQIDYYLITCFSSHSCESLACTHQMGCLSLPGKHDIPQERVFHI